MSDWIRIQRLSLLVGMMTGQISELLNSIKTVPMTNDAIYKSLRDIHNAAGIQIHELFYKDKERT